MKQAYYAARKASKSRIERGYSPGEFKYISKAVFLSKYATFMDMEGGNKKNTSVTQNIRDEYEVGQAQKEWQDDRRDSVE